MWWQGWTAYSKTLQESWPVYGMGTYVDRELIEAADSVQSSSYIRITGYHQKSRECNKDIWSVARLRFGPVATSLNSLMDLLWRKIVTSHISSWTTDIHLYTVILSPLKMHTHMACTNRSRDTCHILLIGSIRHHLDILMLLPSTLNINLAWNVHSIIQLTSGRFFTMDATDYWPYAREYSIWNTAVPALQFWVAYFDLWMCSNTMEWVYTAFFCSNSAQHLRNKSEELLFSHFVTTINDAFDHELAQEDEGHESGSESLNIPTPLCRAPFLYHVSTCDNLSFGPSTPRTHSPHWPGNLPTVHHHLRFKEDDDSWTDSTTLHATTEHHTCRTPNRSSPLQYRWQWRRRWGTLHKSSTYAFMKIQALMHSWRFTTQSVPVPLPVQFGSAIPWLCTSVYGPQQHFQFPRCNNNNQWWRYS